MPYSHHRFCLAPMMDWSDRHCRYFWRLLTQKSLVYTEMVTSGALLYGEAARFLHYSEPEHPIALQVGGSDPRELAQCAEMAEKWGYDEINLNCGCPSDRVQSGKIGACLMAEPDLVADCVRRMKQFTQIPVTVKHRIGIDDQEDYPSLKKFVSTVAEAGCNVFIVHARKAWLQGLSPKENRDIPPLQYELVYTLKQEFPELEIIINGGIRSIYDITSHLARVDGVMVGREAYQNPFFLADVDSQIYGSHQTVCDRLTVLKHYVHYCEEQIESGVKLHHMSRHILGLFAGEPGARHFRRHISTRAHKPSAKADLLLEAYEIMSNINGDQ